MSLLGVVAAVASVAVAGTVAGGNSAGGNGGEGLVAGGVGGTTFSTLSSIGSDLSVSISFSVASELLASAEDMQLTTDELIGLLLSLCVIVSALHANLSRLVVRRRSTAIESVVKQAKLDAEEVCKGYSGLKDPVRKRLVEVFVSESKALALQKASERRTSFDFLLLLTGILQRISVAIAIQLLASSVRSQQLSRVVRAVSLVSLSCFFVFVEVVSGTKAIS
jgi:hypothetical protein